LLGGLPLRERDLHQGISVEEPRTFAGFPSRHLVHHILNISANAESAEGFGGEPNFASMFWPPDLSRFRHHVEYGVQMAAGKPANVRGSSTLIP